MNLRNKLSKYCSWPRGAIKVLLIDDRRDISDLRAEDPGYVATFERLQMELNRPAPEANVIEIKLFMSRTAIVEQLDRCIDDIRLLTGHSRFLRPPSSDELQKRAGCGIIVTVNISDVRSDAILVTASSIQALHLPHLRSSDGETWFRKGLMLQNQGRMNKEYLHFLYWLWERCVEPILK